MKGKRVRWLEEFAEQAWQDLAEDHDAVRAGAPAEGRRAVLLRELQHAASIGRSEEFARLPGLAQHQISDCPEISVHVTGPRLCPRCGELQP